MNEPQEDPLRDSDEDQGDAPQRLSVSDHSRDAAQLTYVYPVVSRRAKGVSIGINLNPNNACNWACVYCQVPNLVRGAAPPIDLALLESELRAFLGEVRTDAWMESHAPPESRRINDIAFSGNGEPTTAANFDAIVKKVLSVREEFALSEIKTVLITNGSQLHRPEVLRGVKRMANARGEVWFKIDSVTAAGRVAINGVASPETRVRTNLRASAAACTTWVQTCVFAVDGEPPSKPEQAAYLDFLHDEIEHGTPLAGVLLYGLARPSLQPGADRLTRLEEESVTRFARDIEDRTGLPVQAHP